MDDRMFVVQLIIAAIYDRIGYYYVKYVLQSLLSQICNFYPLRK